jgi:exonuclease V gamma subunit
MLNLNFAPSLDLLVPKLLNLLRGTWTDPFMPPQIIVPNPAAGKWLRMRLTDPAINTDSGLLNGLGCIAGFEMPALERFLWNSLVPDPNMLMLDVWNYQQIICALLNEQILGLPAYLPVKTYLSATDSSVPDPLKRVQLSAAIARRFLEYEYNRPSVWNPDTGKWVIEGLDAKWLAGRQYIKTDSIHENWQRDLYCKAAACLNTPCESGAPRLISLPHLYRIRREKQMAGGDGWTLKPKTVFLFGVTKISHFHRNLLVEISQMTGMQMHVFLTNPCAEFWEDVDTRRARRAWRHDAPPETAGIKPIKQFEYNKEDLSGEFPQDQKLLELWGAAGKENIFLWCPQAQWNFEYTCPNIPENTIDFRPGTMLKALQYALLKRQDKLPACSKEYINDGTLQILACRDRLREVEELREQILDLVNNNHIQQLNQAVVYMSDTAAYVPAINQIFGAPKPGDPLHIPFSIIGAPDTGSLFADGIRSFLEILRGNFDRAKIFGFLRNPLVSASRGYTESDITIWENWAEELGIYRGYDRSQRADMGDKALAATDAHTFEASMARMLLGNLTTEPVELDYILLNNSSQQSLIPPFSDWDTADKDLLENFCTIIEDINTDISDFRDIAAKSTSSAIQKISLIVRRWFGSSTQNTDPNLSSEAGACRSFIDSLSSILLQISAAERSMIPALELYALIEACIPEQSASAPSAWTGGITFVPLKPSMIMPHDAIFVLGLDAAAFPGVSDRPGWDLLSGKRIMGDSDLVRDNRFAFLELIHSAKKRLILSYISCDMQKEEELQPSSVLLELDSWLKSQGQDFLRESGRRCAIFREIPWIPHESLNLSSKPERLHATWSSTDRELAALSAQKRFVHRHDIPEDHRHRCTNQPDSDKLSTDFYQIKRFFSNPLEYHVLNNLGIDIDDSPDTIGATDEPLFTNIPEMSSLQNKIWTQLLSIVFPANTNAAASGDSLEKTAEDYACKAYEQHIMLGKAPEAQFMSMEQQAVIDWAKSAELETLNLKSEFPNHILVENADLVPPDINRKFKLEIQTGINQTCSVECRHKLALLPAKLEPGSFLGIINFQTKGKAFDNPDLWLSGVLQWLAFQKSGILCGIKLVQLNRGDGAGISISNIRKDYSDVAKTESWLASLLCDMLVNRKCEHFPVKTIRDVYCGDWQNITPQSLAEELENEHSAYRSYVKAFNLCDARIPDMDAGQLQNLARLRFAPMLEGWLHE